LPGEIVSLYIGDIFLGSAPGKSLLTPLDLVSGAIDETDPQVTNILRFTQSLDSDNDPDNGISISNIVATQALGQSLDFSLATADFEIAANALISMLTSGEVTTLVDASAAQAHFVGSLGGAATEPPANDVPVGVDDGYTTLEDTALVVAAAGVLANDTDTNPDTLQALLVTDVSNGTLALNTDGSFTYAPNPNFNGTDRFIYRASDGSGSSKHTKVFIWVDADDPDDLVRLLLDEGSGAIALDDSYNDGIFNDGILIGDPIYDAASGDGSAFSLRLDGIDDHIDLGDIDVVGPGLTLATWFNADSLPGWHPPLPLIAKSSAPPVEGHVFALDIAKWGDASRLRAWLRIGGETTFLIAEDGDLISGVGTTRH